LYTKGRERAYGRKKYKVLEFQEKFYALLTTEKHTAAVKIHFESK